MEDESSRQKKLSFSIDNILDKPQPLFLKIKHHHVSSDYSGISTSDDEEEEEGSYSEDGLNNRYNHQEMMHRKKKTRTVFSRTQIFQLETTFDRKRYLSSADRANLAQGLRLTEQQIKIWFQNRRNKLKRQVFEASQSINSMVASLQTPSSSSSSSTNSIIKHPLSIPSDFSSSPSSSSPVSSKVHHRFDPTSFYELASLAAAHAAAAFHHNKSQHSPTTFQGFTKSLTTPTAV